MSRRLSCYACGSAVAAPAAPRCDCGEPRWYDIDPETLAELRWPPDLEDRVWAFDDLLPVDPPDDGVATAAGGTPLIRTPTLDEYAGARVSVKDEGRNPTGSFKDRGSAVGIALALAAGADAVGTVSHGNMAMSTASVAAAADLDCVVCVPADISAERLRNIGRYDPRIIRVDGDYGRLYYDALEIGRERGVRFVNSDTPGRVAGQKTTVLEALAQHRRRTGSIPDALVLPVSSGGHASGAYQGLLELRQAGLIGGGDSEGDAEADTDGGTDTDGGADSDTDLPRLYLVQAAACAPIARAYRDGLDAVERVEKGETIAYSIANPDPPSGTRALTGARETGGAVVAVDDEAILDAKRRLAADAGLAVEASSATTLAGLRELTAAGEIDANEAVVCVATGSGFKESVGDAAPPEPETVALSDLGDAL